MSDEHDSWVKDAFGLDLGQVVQGIADDVKTGVNQVASTVTQVVAGVQGAVEGVIDGVTGAVKGAVKTVASAVAGAASGAAAGASGGATGSFPLGGSVGRGGKNAPNDVRAVQTALGIAADGQCGGQTIGAIEAFQRNMGQAKPDGRVDAGGATERALAGGAKPAAPPAASDASGADGEGGLLGQVVAGAKGLLGGLGDAAQQIGDAAQGVLDSGGAATADDLNAGSGSFAQGLAEGIVRAMNEGRDLAFLLTRLKNLDMRELLEVMDHLKRAGKLPEFASRATREPPRVRAAILTVLPSFDAEWRRHLGGLNEADKRAVLERTPKSVQDSSGLASEGGGGNDEDPGGTVEVDLAGVAVAGKIEFNSKAFGVLGQGEVAVKLGADGKLQEVEVDVAKIKTKLEKLGKLGPILDLEATVSLKASAEIGEHEKKTVVEGVKAGVATEIGVTFKKVPGLKKVTLKFTAGAGTGGFEFGGAIEIPIPGT